MAEKEIVDTLQRYFRALRNSGIDVAFGMLYGSHSRGTADSGSDIDVVVVAPVFDVRRDHEPVDRLWIVKSRIDHRIEPIPCGFKEWELDDSRAIIEIARRAGEKVEPADAA